MRQIGNRRRSNCFYKTSSARRLRNSAEGRARELGLVTRGTMTVTELLDALAHLPGDSHLRVVFARTPPERRNGEPSLHRIVAVDVEGGEVYLETQLYRLG